MGQTTESTGTGKRKNVKAATAPDVWTGTSKDGPVPQKMNQCTHGFCCNTAAGGSRLRDSPGPRRVVLYSGLLPQVHVYERLYFQADLVHMSLVAGSETKGCRCGRTPRPKPVPSEASARLFHPEQSFRCCCVLIYIVCRLCFSQVTEFDPKNSRDRFYTLSIDQEKRRGPYRTMAQVIFVGSRFTHAPAC